METTNRKKQAKEEVEKRLDVAFDKLFTIWDKIGIDEEQVCGRAATVSMHVCNLLDEMVSEEQQMCDNMATNIQRSIKQLSALSAELALPVVKVSDSLTMLQRDRDLSTQLDNLKRQKDERLKKLKQLLQQDEALCQALCSTPHYVSSHAVPTPEQLQQLETHVKSLQAEKEKRHKEFLSMKRKVVALCNEMDYQPESSFEKDIMSDEDDCFQLTTDNMDSLKTALQDLEARNLKLQQQGAELWENVHTLWQRLDVAETERSHFTSQHQGHKLSTLSGLREEIARCERLKQTSLHQVVEGARRELVEWWGRCYVGMEQRQAFLPFHADEFTEQLLEDHEREVKKWRSYYSEHMSTLDLLAKHHKLWHEMREFEKKASDPNRFFNDRGGKFLMEEKARKKLMKELPKVEDDVKEAIEVWEKDHGQTFLVEGVAFTQYLDNLWTSFRKEKEQEKQERLKNKAKEMEVEMVYGSKPKADTPVKRRGMNTPSHTPLKARKMKENMKTPSSVKKVQHSSVAPSPYARQPLMPAKTPNVVHTSRRRSVRLARKRLQESMQKASTDRCGKKKAVAAKRRPEPMFSQTTKGLNQTARPNCRSSVAPAASASPPKLW